MRCNCSHYNALGCWVGQDTRDPVEELRERIRVRCPIIDDIYDPECKERLLRGEVSEQGWT